MLLVKILLLLTFFYILLEDYRERQVYWFIFLIVGLLCSFLYYTNTIKELFAVTVLMNLIFICVQFLVVFLYSKFKLKVKFNEAFGVGDVLFFIAMAFTFSTISFLVVFIFSLIFSISLHLVLNKKSKFSTVPLAGYMSLFFAITYIAQWAGILTNLYII